MAHAEIRPLRLELTARHLGLAELEPVREPDLCEVRCSCHRVSDWLQLHFHYPRHAEAASARLEIDAELDWSDDQVKLADDGRAVDVEDGVRLLLPSRHDLEKGVPLRRCRAGVDEALSHAAAFVNRSGPAVARADDRPVEPHIAEIAF